MLSYQGCQYSRANIPPEAIDFETWKNVDPSVLPEKERRIYLRRREAITLYFEQPNLSLKDIANRTGISRSYINTLAQNCLKEDDQGCQRGFLGLQPYRSQKQYKRLKTCKKRSIQHGGLSGAFTALLDQHPELKEFLDKKAESRTAKVSRAKETKPSYKSIHSKFLKKCREIGIGSEDYPFTTREAGYRTLTNYVKQIQSESWSASVTDAGGRVLTATWRAEDDPLLPKPAFPYDAVELDGHKIDLRLTIKIRTPYGIDEPVECTRIWILALGDVVTKCILGYYLVPAIEYSTDDIIEAIHHSLHAERFSHFSIPELTYKPGAGFPSSNYKELRFMGFKSLRVDNAKANLSNKLMSVMTRVIGCWPDAGPVGMPNSRAFIESFFRNLSVHFAHRLPGTTGRSPEDIRRALSDPNGELSLLITLEELQEMIEVIIANYNATQHSSLGGKTPLEAMQYFLMKEPCRFYPISKIRQKDLCLFYESKVVTVRGNEATGERPHINFENSRYSNDVLSNAVNMIGKQINIYYSSRDLRKVQAFLMTGEEFGILHAELKWRYTKHSLQTRRAIMSLRRARKLSYQAGDDAVEKYIEHKRKTAKRCKRDATELAKLLIQSGEFQQPRKKVLVESTSETDKAGPREKPKLINLKLKKTVVF